MKKNGLPKLTPSEFEIMDAVWTFEELTLTEIMSRVNRGKTKKLKRTTIQVQVKRLEEKGWLKHYDIGNKFKFCSTVSRHEASGDIVVDVNERIFGGSCVELVKSLFANTNVSMNEVKKLRELIDKYEED